MKKYQYIERSTALALNDVNTLQALAKQRIIDLKNLARDSDSVLVFSIIREACMQIDQSINDAIDNARNLLKQFEKALLQTDTM